LEDILNKKSGSLIPKPVKAWYSVEKKCWTDENPSAADLRAKLVLNCKLVAHLAKTGRASCRRCGLKIDKDVLRVGYPLKGMRGDIYNSYMHLKCFPPEVFDLNVKNLKDEIYGFTDLSRQDQMKIKNVINGKKIDDDEEANVEAPVVEDHCGEALAIRQAPAAVTANLLKFQKEGLGWLIAQEDPKRSMRGGILADEMGMGKTLQMISLIVANRNKEATKGRPTLVVAPVAAVPQWMDEVEKYTKAGTLKVVIYHGGERKAINISAYDIVITTYQTLEGDYRREMDKYKVECMYCKRLFHKSKLETHLRYFCGPEAEKTAKLAKQEKKAKEAAKKGMSTMGIGGKEGKESEKKGTKSTKSTKRKACDSGDPAPPTISNIYRGILNEAGVKVQARGYWQMTKEAKKLASEREKKMKKEDGNDNDSDSSSSEKDDGSDSNSSESDDEGNAMKKRKVMKKETKEEKNIAVRAAGMSRTDIKNLKIGDLRALVQEYGLEPTGTKKELAEIAVSKLFPRKVKRAKEERTVATMGKGATKGSTKMTQPPDDESSDSDSDTVEEHNLKGSKLHNTEWGRIILDEAHRIKARTNSTAMAAFALKGTIRWCVTGTPLQNRIGELYSLVRFLQFKPFAYYYCKVKNCACEQLSFMGNTRYCPHCSHSRMLHYSHFKRTVSNPILKFGFNGAGRDAFYMLQNKVLKDAMLRRTKLQKHDDLNLPPMVVVIRREEFSQEERDFYESLYKESRTKFDTYVKKGTLANNYAHIFDLLTSLRRACDHPYLNIYRPNNAAVEKTEMMDICRLCQDSIEFEESAQVACSCTFHYECIKDYVDEAPTLEPKCPSCFVKLNFDAPKEKTKGKRGRKQAAAAESALPRSPNVSADAASSASSGSPPIKMEMMESPLPAPANGRAQRMSQTPVRGVKKEMVKNEKTSPLRPEAKEIKKSVKEVKKMGTKREEAVMKRGRPKKEIDENAAPSNSAVPVKQEENENVDESDDDNEAAFYKPDPVIQRKLKGRKSILQCFRTSQFATSTKIEAVCAEVEAMPAQDKGIIFSQFSTMLELTGFVLKRKGVNVVSLIGSMSMDSRQASLKQFHNDPKIRVILISLKAGGEGLNLQIANHVFLLDPWWNPASEMQAIQRAHRIGQTKKVRGIRIVIKGTIEEKILELQEKKQLVFDGAVDGSVGSMQKLTAADLQFLFQH